MLHFNMEIITCKKEMHTKESLSQVLILSLTSCMTLDELLNFSQCVSFKQNQFAKVIIIDFSASKVLSSPKQKYYRTNKYIEFSGMEFVYVSQF